MRARYLPQERANRGGNHETPTQTIPATAPIGIKLQQGALDSDNILDDDHITSSFCQDKQICETGKQVHKTKAIISQDKATAYFQGGSPGR